jgi:fido (protein-threonine AMPylation protein)
MNKALKKTQHIDKVIVSDLHRRMFNKTWNWAGRFRKSAKSIGIDWLQIPVVLKNLLDDAADVGELIPLMLFSRQ